MLTENCCQGSKGHRLERYISQHWNFTSLVSHKVRNMMCAHSKNQAYIVKEDTGDGVGVDQDERVEEVMAAVLL